MVLVKEEKARQSLFEMISQIISSAEGLKRVYLTENFLCSSSTTSIINALGNSASIETIEEVDLEMSANLSENDSCEAIADFLAAAKSLTKLDI